MDETLRDDWEMHVGKFILICGEIEMALLQLHWNLHLDRDDFISIRKTQISDKVKKTYEALESSNISENMKKDIEKILSKVSNLMSTRNLVAHNPLFLEVFENENKYKFQRKIASLRDREKYITLPRLVKEIDTAKSISDNLFKIITSDLTGSN